MTTPEPELSDETLARAIKWHETQQFAYIVSDKDVLCALRELQSRRRSPKREDVIESISGKIVQCVVCLDEQGECVHIFSTRDRLEAFIATDPRRHVVYDYMIDNPDRMEKPLQ